MFGYIARKRADRGFGFIREGAIGNPGTREWFFHSRDCDPRNPFAALKENDAVEFEVMAPEPVQGPRALFVTLSME